MKQTITTKQRNSNLELFRIIVMLLIIAHHYVVNSGVWEVIESNGPSVNSFFYYLLGMWGKTGINCFVLITGWFMCTSQITLRKFLKLLLEVEFYRIILSSIFFLLEGKSLLSMEWFITILPVRSIRTDFISTFLVFYLFIPFLNTLIKNLTRKEHLSLMALLLFVYTFMGTVPVFRVTMNYLSWFCTLYVVSSFMRLYDFPLKEKRRAWFWLSMLSIFVSVLSVVALVFSNKNVSPYWFLSDANKVLALVASICFFNLFRTISIPQSRFINAVGATTFGVLLIHAHSDSMRKWLWVDVFDNVGHLSVPYYALRAIAVVVIVFVVCACIDYLRILFIERPLFGLYDKVTADGFRHHQHC